MKIGFGEDIIVSCLHDWFVEVGVTGGGGDGDNLGDGGGVILGDVEVEKLEVVGGGVRGISEVVT